MDLWMVAVAAGAGCLAKYWQNISRDRNSLPAFSSGDSNCGKPESPGRPFHRLARRKKLDDEVSADRKWVSDGRLSDLYQIDGASAEVTSTSGFDVEKSACFEKYEDCNVLSVSSLPPGCSTNDDVEHEAGNRLSGDVSDNCGNSLPGLSPGMGSFRGSSRNRSSLRTKRSHRHSLEPLSSLESCLMTQLYKEHAEMKRYVFSPPPSPSTPAMRQLFVTDRSQILSRANGHSFSAQIGFEEDKVHKEAYLERNENVHGVTPLPKIRSLDFPMKMKKTGKVPSGRLSSSIKMVGGKHVHSQDGSPDGMILFCLGISIGIISSFITNKREVDKLKELVKQTENLVQDLQEELDMKDSMTVKELANENYESQVTCNNSYDRAPTVFSPELHMDGSTKNDGKVLYDLKAEESPEPMSKIEAELEAELERLELNINASSLDRRLSGLVELDPDFVADFAQGELRADMTHDRAVGKPNSDPDSRDTSTTHSANYAVSPRELSLRLHEVIRSRLEERVQDLETALQNSQRKLNHMESGHKNSWKEFSSSERAYSCTPESSTAKECNPTAQFPFNLSGETLDADKELTKIDDSEEQDLASRVHESKHQEGFNLSDGPVFMGENGGSMSNLTMDMELFSSKTRTRRCGGYTSEFQGLNDGVSEDESSDWDDEIENQLIKQIVEKTKKGSHVVLNAQRMFLSMDEK
ncbi:uncharacterized protein LOC133875605 [Alnus glutinosa]|uniref:uncharacterized protein LOC133875605 n=1 Tax=Alnus glutinosa TaxID=3517 RepID=UPI002D76778F|nr:uncharacterized protein LOC133875605 [Alnus glutinosa]